jgi:hypothetical protein
MCLALRKSGFVSGVKAGKPLLQCLACVKLTVFLFFKNTGVCDAKFFELVLPENLVETTKLMFFNTINIVPYGSDNFKKVSTRAF